MVAGPRRNSCPGLPRPELAFAPVGTRKPGVEVTLREKLCGSGEVPHTASYTRRSCEIVNSGGQNAAASVVYSSFARARSTPSASRPARPVRP